eukprot:363620-Chlamydomonas_euryale.AAC.2
MAGTEEAGGWHRRGRMMQPRSQHGNRDPQSLTGTCRAPLRHAPHHMHTMPTTAPRIAPHPHHACHSAMHRTSTPHLPQRHAPHHIHTMHTMRTMAPTAKRHMHSRIAHHSVPGTSQCPPMAMAMPAPTANEPQKGGALPAGPTCKGRRAAFPHQTHKRAPRHTRTHLDVALVRRRAKRLEEVFAHCRRIGAANLHTSRPV